MYTATISSKEIVRGVLSVNVIFTDGKDTFTENFSTRSASEEWLQSVVDNRLTELASIKEAVVGIDVGAGIEPTKPLEE
jgi:hypothetical protein